MTERAESILGFLPRGLRWNTVCQISPEQARRILESQPKQRPVSQSHVDALVSEIKSGRFVRTNEAIAFDETGALFDGQHRMWACFESGFSIEVLCCFNEPRENFARIGTVTRKRTSSDHLAIDGIVNDPKIGSLVGAAGKFIWAYDNGINPSTAYTVKGWSHDLLRATLARHPDLIPIASRLHACRMLFPRAVLIALATLMREANAEKAALFEHQILTGEGLSEGDPALTLRNSASSNYNRRGARVEMAYRIARAWNAFAENRSIRTLYGSNAAGSVTRSRAGGMDPFPQLIGAPAAVRRKKEQNSKRDQPALPVGKMVSGVGAAP